MINSVSVRESFMQLQMTNNRKVWQITNTSNDHVFCGKPHTEFKQITENILYYTIKLIVILSDIITHHGDTATIQLLDKWIFIVRYMFLNNNCNICICRCITVMSNDINENDNEFGGVTCFQLSIQTPCVVSHKTCGHLWKQLPDFSVVLSFVSA